MGIKPNATKAEMQAYIEEMEAKLRAVNAAAVEAAPVDPSLVEEVIYQSDFRANRVNFPFRETQGGLQGMGQRPPMAEFQPAGDKGLYKTQDPKEIEWLDHLCNHYPHLRILSRSMVRRDPFGGAPIMANVPAELMSELNAVKRISPALEGEPV